MKRKFETTTKTTVTLNVKEFLSSLNIKESGKLYAVIVQPERVLNDAFTADHEPIIQPQQINLHFESVENRELEN